MLTLFASAQYTTPGTGVHWNLDSLVSQSAGAVVQNDNGYAFVSPIIISTGDSLSLMGNDTILMHDLSYIESSGYLNIAPPDGQIIFTSADTSETEIWRGIRLNELHTTNISNAVFEYGGGIRVLGGGSFHMENSVLRYNYYKSGTNGSFASGGAIDITGPGTIVGNSFISNQRSGISSGANTQTPVVIKNNFFFGNVTENSNRPQINLGPTGLADTTFIIGNTVLGNGFTNSGGIAFSSLTGVGGNVVIDSNIVNDNRYGITLTGSPIYGWIRYNTISGNNIQNDPDLGGSGINLTASNESSTLEAVITGNTINENLWGITIIGYPVANMGDTTQTNYNPGLNLFTENGNIDGWYDLYNNGPVNQLAMGNCWSVVSQDSVSIDSVIFHHPDNPALGLVTYMPANCSEQWNVSFYVLANDEPFEGAQIFISADTLITNMDGFAAISMPAGTYPYTVIASGYDTVQGFAVVDSTDITITIGLITHVNDLSDNLDRNIRLFPNPAQSEVTLKEENGVKIERIDMFNSNGLLMRSYQKIRSPRLKIDDIPAGYYILKIYTNQNKERPVFKSLIINK